MFIRPSHTMLAGVAVLAIACGGEQIVGSGPDEPGDEAPEDVETPEDVEEPPLDGDVDDADDAGASDDATGHAPDPGEDPDGAEASARELLGLSEDELEEDADTRVVRRGDEDLPGTMDLRPGRRNVELDDDGSGTYVVTRVVIESSEDELVVE